LNSEVPGLYVCVCMTSEQGKCVKRSNERLWSCLLYVINVIRIKEEEEEEEKKRRIWILYCTHCISQIEAIAIVVSTNNQTIKTSAYSCTLVFNRKKAKDKLYCHVGMLFSTRS
jgi:hypothetical protein